MRRILHAIIETIRDPFAVNPTASEKNAWNLADVMKSIASAVIGFLGAIPLVAILQILAGHPEQFGENGPLVSAGCLFLIQLVRTFRQGKPDKDNDQDDGKGGKGENHPDQPLPNVAGPWA